MSFTGAKTQWLTETILDPNMRSPYIVHTIIYRQQIARSTIVVAILHLTEAFYFIARNLLLELPKPEPTPKKKNKHGRVKRSVNLRSSGSYCTMHGSCSNKSTGWNHIDLNVHLAQTKSKIWFPIVMNCSLTRMSELLTNQLKTADKCSV